MIDLKKTSKCNSIKSIVVKGNTVIDAVSRFKGKMLMLVKNALKSFLYDSIDFLCFQMEEVRRIYDQHDIIKCHIYLNVSDTSSCSWFFQFSLLKRM